MKEALKQYIVTELMRQTDLGVLADDTPLIENGIIDSMGLIELVLFIERQFGITVAEEEMEIDNFKTLNSLAAYVESKIAGR